jgi:cytosine permease
VLMALAAKTNDVASIMMQTSGWIGALVVVASTVKINNLNLYSSSLGFTTIFDTLFKMKPNRGMVTLVIGVIGTVLSVLGILDKFVSFLVLLGVLIPPVAGIMVIDYFVLKTHRKVLDTSRLSGELPPDTETISPITLFAWAAGFAAGYFVKAGIPSINSLLVSAVVYYAGMLIMRSIKSNVEEKAAL